MSEVSPDRMLVLRHIVSPLLLVLTHSNSWRSLIWIFGAKSYAVLTVSGLSAGLSVSRPDWYVTLLLVAEQFSRPCWRPRVFSTSIFFWIRARNDGVFATVLVCSLKSCLSVLFSECIRFLYGLFFYTKSLKEINACQIVLVLCKCPILSSAHGHMCLSQFSCHIVFQVAHKITFRLIFTIPHEFRIEFGKWLLRSLFQVLAYMMICVMLNV